VEHNTSNQVAKFSVPLHISYNTLFNNHYSSNVSNASYKSGPDIYSEIGYVYDDLVKQNEGYKNTCAVRMNRCLLTSGQAKGRPIYQQIADLLAQSAQSQ
jgi:hypothetical protein